MTNDENPKRYDLEDRTAAFAEAARIFVRALPRTISNIEDVKQFIRASGSIGANYIESNEALGKKDFVMKIKICRREAKRKRLLAWFDRRRCQVGGSAKPLVRRSEAIDENFRRHRSQVRRG